MRLDKNTLRMLMVCIMIFSCAAALALAGSPRPSAQVVAISGKAEYRSSSGSEWVRLTRGQKLLSGGQIRTGSKSMVDLLLLERYCIEIGENTIITIPEDTLAGHAHSIYLVMGRIWARVVRSGSEEVRFDVETDAAVAGVRGTVFSVAYFDRTTVSVREGQVEVSSRATDRRVMVPGGRQVVVERGRIPGPVTAMTKNESEVWGNAGPWILGGKKAKKNPPPPGNEKDDHGPDEDKEKAEDGQGRHND